MINAHPCTGGGPEEVNVRKYSLALSVLAIAASILSCRAGPSTKTDAGVDSAFPGFKPRDVVEHKTAAGGQDAPPWIFEAVSQLESYAEYEESYVFKFVRRGADLQELEDWMGSFPADESIAGAVVGRIRTKWDGAQFEGKELAEPYLEEALRIVEAAEYAGTRRRADHWVLVQVDRKKRKEYRAYMLFTAPRGQVHSAIDRAIRNEERRKPPASDEVRAALDWLRLLLSEGV